MLASLSTHHFEQKFEYLHVSPRLGEVAAPGVEPMPADQESVRLRMLGESPLHSGCRGGPILCVLENRHPLAVLVGCHALQTLEHLVPFDGDAVPIAI